MHGRSSKDTASFEYIWIFPEKRGEEQLFFFLKRRRRGGGRGKNRAFDFWSGLIGAMMDDR